MNIFNINGMVVGWWYVGMYVNMELVMRCFFIIIISKFVIYFFDCNMGLLVRIGL